MKKSSKILLVFILTLVLVFSLSACTFVIPDNGFTPSIGGGGLQPPATNLNVSIKEQPTETRQALTLEQANVKVERSIVTIETNGLGAGVIIDIDVEGVDDDNYIYIVTCHHLLESKGDITVYIPDAENPDSYVNPDYIFTGTIGGLVSSNQDKAVTLVGSDFKSDIGVIKVNLSKPAKSGKVLPISKIVKAVIPAPDYKLLQGEAVFAIGNPTGGLPGWLCSGIVASLENSVPVSDIGNMKLMGISAPTNPGNSGGGLFNMYGELIGITNAGNMSYDAINYAIPLYTSDKDSTTEIDNGVVNMITKLVGSATATNYGYIYGRKAMLGITITKGTTNSGQEVAYILDVVDGGVASTAGMKKNDIIIGIKVNGVEVIGAKTYEEINKTLGALRIGDKVTLKVQRTGALNQVTSYDITMDITQFHFCNTGL